MQPWPPPLVTRVAALPPHTITLARTTHAHACSMTLGERVCVRQGVSACVVATMAPKLWRAGKRGQRSRHTLDAPALQYVPAVQEVHVAADDEDDPGAPYLPAAHAEPEHVADELAPVALEYFPATQSVHSEAPAV